MNVSSISYATITRENEMVDRMGRIDRIDRFTPANVGGVGLGVSSRHTVTTRILPRILKRSPVTHPSQGVTRGDISTVEYLTPFSGIVFFSVKKDRRGAMRNRCASHSGVRIRVGIAYSLRIPLSLKVSRSEPAAVHLLFGSGSSSHFNRLKSKICRFLI